MIKATIDEEGPMVSTGESITAGNDLSGRWAVVTGASSGLGRECARVLALRGADVGLACRSPDRAAAVVGGYARDMGPTAAARCHVLPCDLTRMASVRALAATLIAAGRPVDVLLLNAGVSNQPYSLTPDGVEATFAANYLGHFLLLHLLAEAGVLAPAARIVVPLSSAVHRNPWARADIDMLTRPAAHAARFSPLRASPSTKVMLALMGLEFTRRAVGTPLAEVTYVGVSPGAVRTGNVDQMGPWVRRLVLPLVGLFSASRRRGRCAAALGGDGPRGGARPGRGLRIDGSGACA